MTTPQSRPPSERAFDPVAPFYDQFYDTALGRAVDELEKDLLYELAELHPGEQVLEVGAGTGHFAFDLAARGMAVVGADLSWPMLQGAHAKRAAGAPLPLVQADAACLPLSPARFDLVLSVTALEFVARPEQMLQEMWRMLRPGGRLVVATLNARGPWAEARAREAAQQETPFAHGHFFTAEELVAMLGIFGPVAWNSSVFIGPDGKGLEAARLLEETGRRLRRDQGALLVGRVRK